MSVHPASALQSTLVLLCMGEYIYIYIYAFPTYKQRRRLCFIRAKLMNLTSHFTSSHVGYVVVKQTEDYVEMGFICKMLIRSFLKISQPI